MGVVNYYDVGEMGVEHALLPEKGLVCAGELIIGADSHTCTYGALGAFSTGVGSTDMAAGMATGEAWFKVPSAIRFNLKGKLNKWVSGKDVILHIIGMIGVDGALYQSMEFGGEGLKNLTMDDRLCMANMAIEAGAKNGIFEVDDVTREYMKGRVDREYKEYAPDPDAEYPRVIDIDLSEIKSTVSFPHLPENARPIDEVGDVKIDQVVIGSCTNGRLSQKSSKAKRLRKTCAALSFRLPKKFGWNASNAAIWIFSWKPAALFPPRLAAPASAVIWASSQRASARLRPLTGTLSAVWAM